MKFNKLPLFVTLTVLVYSSGVVGLSLYTLHYLMVAFLQSALDFSNLVAVGINLPGLAKRLRS